MPYQQGQRLPGERASKLGHLDVLKSKLVNELCDSFETPEIEDIDDSIDWTDLPATGKPLRHIFTVDGSIQDITSETAPHRQMSFIKTALLRLDTGDFDKINKQNPNPFQLRDIMADSAVYHATVMPTKNVIVAGKSVFDTVRQIIYESMKDQSLNGEPFETFKWLVYEKWSGAGKILEPFECPHCGKPTSLQYDSDEGSCAACSKHIYVTDMLGFQQVMTDDYAPEEVGRMYMLIHETMLLFTGVRRFWDTDRSALNECLFIKDGPLSIRAQYSKLVAPIRRLFAHAMEEGVTIHMMGQEKTGYFCDYLESRHHFAPNNSCFIPNDFYIKTQIQHRPVTGALYGKDTNYGTKLFLKFSDYDHMVISIPTSKEHQLENPSSSDMIGFDRILATLPTILSSRFEGALLPIELANGIASLSTYPSARILQLFATK